MWLSSNEVSKQTLTLEFVRVAVLFSQNVKSQTF